jgi:hypothetical protein
MKHTEDYLKGIVKSWNEEHHSYLHLVWTTSGRNGYPENTGYAIVGFDKLEEIEAFKQAHKGFEYAELYCRDGWPFWNYETLLSQPDYFDVYKDEQDRNIEGVYPYINDGNFDMEDGMCIFGADGEGEEAEGMRDFLMQVEKDIKSLDKNHYVLVDYYDKTIDVLERYRLYYSYDTHNYAIGLVYSPNED